MMNFNFESEKNKQAFYSLSRSELSSLIEKWGKQKFRSQQLFKWIYEKKTTDFNFMSNLSKDFRDQLKEKFHFELPIIKKHLVSVDGTQKFLFEIAGGLTVESVLIPSEGRLTLCISSEVGCNMGCKFCLTGKQNLKRRLKAEEIVGQYLQAKQHLNSGLGEIPTSSLPSPVEQDENSEEFSSQESQQKISNIVFMGMGEPLDNSDEVFKAIDILNDEFGLRFPRRKITISTSGIIPEIPKVAKAKVRLAVSLNGYNDEVRSQIMPINKKYPLKELLSACREYAKETGEKVTLEYVLLKGVTDQLSHAQELYKLTRHLPCKINIIAFNEHPDSGFERPSGKQIDLFHKKLMDLGAHVLYRRSMGRDIFAACGQLISSLDKKTSELSK